MAKSRKVFGFEVHDIAGTGKAFIDCASVVNRSGAFRGESRCGVVVYRRDVERAVLDLIRSGVESWDAYRARKAAA